MGVTGLWRLVEPAGKPVPVETLENKVLAVDISIWLHQMVKGYQDAKGAPLPNAHLMGLFQRLCKLLYFRIKPVFVFDGGFPDLKKETIARRQYSKSKYNSESERLKRELALLLSKKTAVSSLLGKEISPTRVTNNEQANNDDIFKLPALPQKEDSESESEDETSSGSIVDINSVDIDSENFKTLSVKEKYDMLVELKETRKMNSWGKLHELPKKSDNFSDFQMQRLLKRRKVQECLEETEKEMGDVGMSLNELESFLNEEGIDTKIESLPSRRIASNNNTRFLLISDVKQALADAKKKKEEELNSDQSKIKENTDLNLLKRDELEEDLEKAIKMSLECVNEENLNEYNSKTDDSWTSIYTDSDYTDSEDEDGFKQPENMSSAKAYIMQYTDFTHKQINKMVTKASHKISKIKAPEIDKIIEELQNEKSVIDDKIDLSSSDDNCVQNASDSPDFDIRSVVEMNSKLKKFHTSASFNVSQESIVCVENAVPDTIELDSSTDRGRDELSSVVKDSYCNQNVISKQIKIESSESSLEDSDFEEVPDSPETVARDTEKKTVVELTLNVGDGAPDDDIFADVFSDVQNVMDNIKDIKVAKSNIILQDNAKPGTSRDFFIYNEPIDAKDNPSDKITYIDKKEKQQTLKNLVNKNQVKQSMFDKVVSKSDGKVTDEVIPNIVKNAENVKDTIRIYEPSVEANTSKIDGDLEKAIKMSLECAEKPVVNNKTPVEPISREELNSIADELENHEQDLRQEKSRLDRIGRNITEQMTKEAQELLQLFGIPYIVAPMEAEAQCAFLESVNLTDGTITDDSDIWLFGGRTVYKNFFNQKKHVLQFLAERIERSFNLTREQLILLALLVGSDYTTGVSGVGPVTAMEILASFPFNKKQFLNETSNHARYAKVVGGLQEFKKWVRAGRRSDNTTLKKKLKNVELSDDFPSVRVVQAYMEPNIEKSEDKFTWGDIDITILRDYTKTKFGWSQNKLDEIIKPVLKRIRDRKSQRSIQDFFKRKLELPLYEEQMSKRVKAAVQRMGPEIPLEENHNDPAPKQNTKLVRKRRGTKDRNDGSNEAGVSKTKQNKSSADEVLKNNIFKVVSQVQDGKSTFEINILKTDRFQEIIPQREKDKQSLLQNKMKAIELFRKTKIDRKRKPTKRRPNLPNDKADLSETSDSD